MIPTSVLYYGQETALPEPQTLRAGPLSLLFEQGDLRSIRLEDREILRRVYAAVRDRNWGTVPSVLSHLQTDVGSDSFSVAYDRETVPGEIDFVWHTAITGDSRGTITYTLEGEARSTFLRNRIGLCVLHPVRELAGQPCVVEHGDGTVEHAAFPDAIAPHQPFFDIRKITHEVLPGARAEVRLDGDMFEMEDQRNWSDASFKTYSTPLSLPFPAEIRRGTKIRQTVRLTLSGAPARARTRARPAELTVTVGDGPARPLPRLGLCLPAVPPLTDRALARLRALRLSHLRADLSPASPGYPAALSGAARSARELDVPLEAAVFVPTAADQALRELRELLARLTPPVDSWLVFDADTKSTTPRALQAAREHLLPQTPSAKIGGGTDAYFAQLNRIRPQADAWDFVSYSLNPQVHAFDNASLVETLEAQKTTVESARRFCDGTPVRVSPVTLRPRFNPDATGPDSEARPGELPPSVDVRQMSLFGAAWTLGSLKSLAESGADSLTYYETVGWRGVMDSGDGAPLPESFPSPPGGVFPLYHVLADVGEFAGGSLVPTASSHPLEVEALALRSGRRSCLLLANLCPHPRTVTLRNVESRVRGRMLDETTALRAIDTPEEFRSQVEEWGTATDGTWTLTLRPYAVARLDREEAPSDD